MVVDKYLHTSRRVKGVLSDLCYGHHPYLLYLTEIYLHCTGETTNHLLTYIDCPDKMKLAFGIATVKTMDP